MNVGKSVVEHRCLYKTKSRTLSSGGRVDRSEKKLAATVLSKWLKIYKFMTV